MGALQLTPSRAGTIRRVIRRGSQYICGLCRSTYAQENHAQSCIQGCWSELLELDPVILKRRMIGVAFRCRFCARDYQKHEDAGACADDCKTHQLRLHEAEQSLTDQSDEPLPKKRGFKASPKLKTVKPSAATVATPRSKVPPKAAAKTATVLPNPISADVMATPDESVLSSSDAAAGNSSAGSARGKAEKESDMLHGIGSGAYGKKKEEKAAHGVGSGSYSKQKNEPEADGKKVESGAKKLKTSDAFYRDGARYVCNGCQVKYFTRGEVETCFAGHK